MEIAIHRHCCPVNRTVLALKARISAGFEAKMRGVESNWMERFSEFFREDAHEHRQAPVRPAHGLPAMG